MKGQAPARSAPPLKGEVEVPGDKSISHRALVLSALAKGPARVTNLNVGEDVLATARILAQLGVFCVVDRAKAQADVVGGGWEGLAEPEDVLDCGNSGTTLRILLAVCAATPGCCVLTGDETLRRRPMLRVVAPLREMGAAVDGRRGGSLAPLVVRGGELSGIDHRMNVASAQVKTAVLLAGLRASGRTSVSEPAQSRDHTERMLVDAGLALQRSALTVSLEGGQELPAVDRRIPGDLSAAVFLLVAAALVEGSDLAVADVGINPTRAGALEALRAMGAEIEVEPRGEQGGEPIGRVRARSSRLAGVSLDPARVPALIDEVPVLAVAATQAEGKTVIRGAQELRVKESDRIAGLATGLRLLGADVEELPDGLVVTGPTPLGGGELECLGDHRLALAFAVAGLVADGSVRVRGWSAINTSFPDFLSVLGEAQGRSRRRG